MARGGNKRTNLRKQREKANRWPHPSKRGQKKQAAGKRKHPDPPSDFTFPPKRTTGQQQPDEPSTDEDEMVEMAQASSVMQLLSTFDGNTAIKKKLQAIDSEDESNSSSDQEEVSASSSGIDSDKEGDHTDENLDSSHSDESDAEEPAAASTTSKSPRIRISQPIELAHDDPFLTHFEWLMPDTFAEKLLSATMVPEEVHKLKWPSLGSLQFHCNADPCKVIPKPQLSNSWEKAGVVPMLADGFRTWNHQFTKESDGKVLSGLQEELFTLLSRYQDVYNCNRTFGNCEEIRSVYCLHAMNHVLKSASRVKRNDGVLRSKELHGGLNNLDDEEAERYRDQGLTRPKVLIVLPFRESALKVVNTMSKIFPYADQGNIISKNRFVGEFGDTSQKNKPKKEKPSDHKLTFAGNVDDNFRIGMSFTRKNIKLYTKFYSSDILIASPLGLRTIIGAAGEKERDYDFLSSIEMVILDQADIFLMQSWEHVTHLVEHLNIQPVQSHGIDFTRVRNWVINGWSKFYRQNLIFSSVSCPEINALFNRKCCNYAGKIRVAAPSTGGTIQRVLLQLRQVFLRYEAPKCPADDPDCRFNAFVSTVLPQVKSSASPHHILIFVPSYFDFVRLRNHFKRTDSSFVQICEYTPENKMAKARDIFFHAEREMMIYTERAHFYNRIRIKGMIHIVFYQLPVYPHFYSEICNNLSLCCKKFANDVTCTVLYSRLDGHRLASVVGTDRAAHMINSEKTVHMFVSGD